MTSNALMGLAALAALAALSALSASAVAAPGDEPVIDAPVLNPATGYALYGQNVSLRWRVNFTENVTVSTAFFWDTQTHAGGAGGFDAGDYAHSTGLQTGPTNEPFASSVFAPNESAVIYGVVRATLNGTDYYTAQEVVVEVIAPPVLERLSYPEVVDVGQPIPISWRILFGGDYHLIPHTAIHWGLTSRAGLPIDFTSYPGVGGPFKGTAANEFNATIAALDTPGHVYFIVHAVVNGISFYEEEVAVEVRVPDDVGARGFLPGPDGATALMALGVAVALFASSGRGRRS